MLAADLAAGLVPRERLADPAHPGHRLLRHHPLRQAPADEGHRGRHRRRWPPSLVLAAGAAYQWIQRIDAAGGGARGRSGWPGFARSIAASEAASRAVRRAGHPQWTWWQSGGIEFGIGQHIDGLAVMLLLLVAFISLLVQIYSLEYVRGDRRYTHFFAALTLFSAGMLVMVLAENMVQLHPRLGDHGPLLVHADRALVGGGGQRPRRAEGVLHGARRRHRPARRHGDPVLRRQRWTQEHLGATASASRASPAGRCRARRSHDRAAVGRGRPVHRLHRQERPVPAAHLAARRDGRPDAGVVAAALLDDGRRRRVPRRPPLPGVLEGSRHPRRAAST